MRTALLFLALPAVLAAQETPTTLKDQKALAVTVYNDNLALVKDTREVRLPKGDTRLAFEEVSAQIRPETALLRNITASKGFWVSEQNFDFDLLTPQKLLDKYVGKQVTVVRSVPNPDGAGAKEVRETATVLATNGGVVLQFPDRIETSIPGRIVYPGVPANLRSRPTLVISLHSSEAAPQRLELSYLTGGLSWRADYVANLAPDEKTMDLSGWVTLTNQSGAAYPHATLQLVAGDVHQVQAQRNMELSMARMAAPQPPRMQEEGLFEYHLYTLDHPTTLAVNQTKQVALLSASSVPVTKEYLLQGQGYYYTGSYGDLGATQKVGVFLSFQNEPAHHLGMPLPKGILRVYKRDAEGRIQFVGEDQIDHTPVHEQVRLKLGDAFDLTAHRKQTDYQNLGRKGKYTNVSESAYQVVLKNAKKEPVTVLVREPMPGDWEMLQNNLPFTKTDAHTATFRVPVPADGSATLTYRVRVKW